MSLEHLGIKVAKTPQYITAIEKGEIKLTPATLKKFAKALNVDLEMIE